MSSWDLELGRRTAVASSGRFNSLHRGEHPPPHRLPTLMVRVTAIDPTGNWLAWNCDEPNSGPTARFGALCGDTNGKLHVQHTFSLDATAEWSGSSIGAPKRVQWCGGGDGSFVVHASEGFGIGRISDG